MQREGKMMRKGIRKCLIGIVAAIAVFTATAVGTKAATLKNITNVYAASIVCAKSE